jgi:hypothetical protein
VRRKSYTGLSALVATRWRLVELGKHAGLTVAETFGVMGTTAIRWRIGALGEKARTTITVEEVSNPIIASWSDHAFLRNPPAADDFRTRFNWFIEAASENLASFALCSSHLVAPREFLALVRAPTKTVELWIKKYFPREKSDLQHRIDQRRYELARAEKRWFRKVNFCDEEPWGRLSDQDQIMKAVEARAKAGRMSFVFENCFLPRRFRLPTSWFSAVGLDLVAEDTEAFRASAAGFSGLRVAGFPPATLDFSRSLRVRGFEPSVWCDRTLETLEGAKRGQMI